MFEVMVKLMLCCYIMSVFADWRFMMRVCLFMMVATGLVVGVAHSHQAVPVAAFPEGWAYPYGCCSEKDCSYIDAQYVVESPDGYVVSVPVGVHPQVVSEPYYALIPYKSDRIKQSPDGRYHLCVSGQMVNSGKQFLRCFFEPPRAF